MGKWPDKYDYTAAQVYTLNGTWFISSFYEQTADVSEVCQSDGHHREFFIQTFTWNQTDYPVTVGS